MKCCGQLFICQETMRSPEVAQNDEVNSNILVSWGNVCWTHPFYILKVQWIESSSINLHLHKIKLLDVRVGHICSFILEKVQVLNLYLCENKLLNLDTSVECWESPHLKINLKVNDSVPSFSLSFYICWFINVFYNFLPFCV